MVKGVAIYALHLEPLLRHESFGYPAKSVGCYAFPIVVLKLAVNRPEWYYSQFYGFRFPETNQPRLGGPFSECTNPDKRLHQVALIPF